jgi:pilus assembly protein Flp/PilA
MVRQQKKRPHRIMGVKQAESSMKNLLSQFFADESGATAIEYGLIAAGIAVVIIAAVQLIGTNLTTTFNTVASAVKGPAS